MVKAGRLIKENIKYADVIVEVADARIPQSSADTDERLTGSKTKLIALNKADLADPDTNRKWLAYFASKGIKAFLVDSLKNKGIEEILEYAKTSIYDRYKPQEDKGRISRAVKIMVIGIPNSGKSTFINSVVNKKATVTGDKPGVTKNKQWIRIHKDLIMLDMPGILRPKIKDENSALNLAFTGAIKDEAVDVQELAIKLICRLRRSGRDRLEARYGVSYTKEDTDLEIIEKIAFRRGFLGKGGKTDYERCSNILLDEFRAGKLGRMTLEEPPDNG